MKLTLSLATLASLLCVPALRAEEPVDRSAQARFSRESADLLEAWQKPMAGTREDTVRLRVRDQQKALACAVHANGWLVTKASEVTDKDGKLLADLEAEFPNGMRLPVTLSDRHTRYDLALLKVAARGLKTVEWNTDAAPLPGAYLAAVSPDPLPIAVGVVSVSPRSLDDSQKGLLGVQLEGKADGKVCVSLVSSPSAASEAGLLADDIIKSINGKQVVTVAELIKCIAECRPYDTVKLIIQRGEEEKELSATLRSREEIARGEDPRNVMGGRLSGNRRGYPQAIQHDMVLSPKECGGPVIDLDGHVIGLNIARAGRIESYAIPSAVIKILVNNVESGKFHRPELEDLRRELKNATTLLERVRRDHDRLRKQLATAETEAGETPDAEDPVKDDVKEESESK